MFPEPLFWLLLILKMAVTAGFVVFATRAAERAGPVVGAMIATLPVSAGPAYVFIALQHDASFVAQSALASVVVNVVAAVFALVYAMRAQRHGLAASVLPAMAIWFVLVFVINMAPWTTITADRIQRGGPSRSALRSAIGFATRMCRCCRGAGPICCCALRWWRCWSRPWSRPAKWSARR